MKNIASRNANIKYTAIPKQGMMGWDARIGLSIATGRFICLIDGDDQFPPKNIIGLYNKIKREMIDFVQTYRIFQYDGIVRRFISLINNYFEIHIYPEHSLSLDIKHCIKIRY